MVDRSSLRRRGPGVAVAVIALALGIACFLGTIRAFDALDLGSVPSLLLGIPWPAAGVVACALVLGFAVVHAATAPPSKAPDASRTPRRVAGSFLVLAALTGLLAAWSLTAEKVVTLISPDPVLACDVSVLVQCGANLASWQGALFGFPNPLLGLGGWAAVLVMGVTLFRGIRVPSALWACFTAGVVAAMAFVVWLMSQSIFVLGTLCPWCMVTWAVTIPVFWFVTAELARRSSRPNVSAVGARVVAWWPTLTIASYVAVGVVAQLRLDVLATL